MKVLDWIRKRLPRLPECLRKRSAPSMTDMAAVIRAHETIVESHKKALRETQAELSRLKSKVEGITDEHLDVLVMISKEWRQDEDVCASFASNRVGLTFIDERVDDLKLAIRSDHSDRGMHEALQVAATAARLVHEIYIDDRTPF